MHTPASHTEVVNMRTFPSALAAVVVAACLVALVACGGAGAVAPVHGSDAQHQIAGSSLVDTDESPDEPDEDANTSILKHLNTITTIGSTVDPINGDQNPYGLDIARVSVGKLLAGDLVICNFNNAANVQGTGTTIVALRPHPGATPVRIAQNPALNGCDEVALGPNDDIWASAFSANDNPIVSPAGKLVSTLPGGPWRHPFGEVFAPHDGPFGEAAFYETNAADGSIVRINLHEEGPPTFDVIATGFAVNGGPPGSILGPSGLLYDRENDRLFIVDGANNTVVLFRHVSTIPAGGITVNGTTFGGPFRRRARLVFSGPPLNGPISAALLPDDHLVIGNTLDPAGENLMIEITPHGTLLDVKNVDTGAAGAIFGMVACGTRDNPIIYFNDDNDNTTKRISR
jgi:hypothetical protein